MENGKIEITIEKGNPSKISMRAKNLTQKGVIEILEKTANSMKTEQPKEKEQKNEKEHECSKCELKPLCDMITGGK